MECGGEDSVSFMPGKARQTPGTFARGVQPIPVVIDEPLPLVPSLQQTFGQRRPA